MKITTTVFPPATAGGATPNITYPFPWLHPVSGIVRVRIHPATPHWVKIREHDGPDTGPYDFVLANKTCPDHVFTLERSGFSNLEAWACRLVKGSAVHISIDD